MVRNLAYLFPFLVGILLAGLLILGVHAEQERHDQKSRLEVFYKLSAIRSGFENGLNTRMNMAEAVKSLAVLDPGIDQTTFASVSHGLFGEVGGISAVMLARDNVVTHVAPPFGRDIFLGRKLLADFPNNIRALARLAMQSGRPQVSRPMVEMRDDEVIYSLTPVFQTGARGDESYWGMVVVVMETQDIYREAGLSTIAPILDVALREPGHQGAGIVLRGRGSVFESNPVIMDVPIPGGYWQVGAIPTDGWPRFPNRDLFLYGGLGGVVALVALMLVGLHFNLVHMEEREKYHYLVQNARTIILRIDLAGIITFCNEHAEQFYGYEPGELLGKPLIGTIIPEVNLDGLPMKRYLNRLLSDPAAHPFNENINVCRNGEMVWVAWANQPVRRRDGIMVELLCVGTDITDRKIMEEALKARERQYRMLAENVSDVIIGLDTDLNYTFVSPSDAALRGFERQDVLGRPVADFLMPASGRALEETLGPLMREAGQEGAVSSITLDLEFTTKGGGAVWLETRFVLMLNDDQELVGIQGVGRDISDRKRAEALRDDVERMARHDLKTPLGAVVGLPDEIRQVGNLSEQQEAMLSTIEGAGEAMLHLINRSLDLYKMESGTYVLNDGTVDVLEVLERIKNETRSLIRAKGVSVGIDVDGGDRDRFLVRADRALFRSMLSNLLVNAFQASPNGGTVIVTLRRADRLTITITNRGAVPAVMRDVFFDKYTSGNASEGSGLGTYSARLIARTHGGDITLDTSVEGETSVIVSLPA